MDPDPGLSTTLLQSSGAFLRPDLLTGEINNAIIACALLLLCIAVSALSSASENAFFSITPQQRDEIREYNNKRERAILYFLQHQKKLLATVLISNSTVNVSIVLLSSYIFETLFVFQSPLIKFLIQVGLVTFIILLFGEILPKIYALSHNMKIVNMMAVPLFVLSRSIPFSWMIRLLERSSGFIDKRLARRQLHISLDDINEAIELTGNIKNDKEERDLLKGIINFGNLSVKQIMRPRMDIVAFDAATTFPEILNEINEHGYSRIPVYQESLDNITGILHIKDLLPHLGQQADFHWQIVLRKPFFVPENKKLDDLLKEFKEKRVHFAVVADEYGGTSGIVTMEDLMEEIVGDINDEFDDEISQNRKIDNSTYIFEAGVLINDMCRMIEAEPDIFDEVKGDSETLAGFLLELSGKVPSVGEKIKYEGYEFIIEQADKRRIKKVKVRISNVKA